VPAAKGPDNILAGTGERISGSRALARGDPVAGQPRQDWRVAGRTFSAACTCGCSRQDPSWPGLPLISIELRTHQPWPCSGKPLAPAANPSRRCRFCRPSHMKA